VKCEVCGAKTYSRTLPLCPECSRKDIAAEYAKLLHPEIEYIQKGRPICRLCSNECSTGICGLRKVVDGKRVSLVSSRRAILYAYEDPLPTNCCNSWFCKGSELYGTNLAVFYYGCSFDCLFCQNWEHKLVNRGRVVELDEIVELAMKDRIKCICHFGGTPEPQLPFVLRFSEEVLKRRDVMICYEWNGSAMPKLALKAAKLSSESGGTVKFDLKAWNENLHLMLTGRSNERTLENFGKIFENYPEVLSATTLLVPYYVDEREVEGIARFIASLDKEIPYSLLVFHPDYRLNDMPITPKEQVRRCYEVAKKYLNRVHVGNLHLIGGL